ncbi:unnamed protein product [Soboliphyme baturini]|uniref:Protein quiver n=1 Tax=Soboliphyme baturini TaxID=241478 RepID=A0A183ITU2_9BILA|nr:unnamed protein product [Soboliphyme baturini]
MRLLSNKHKTLDKHGNIMQYLPSLGNAWEDSKFGNWKRDRWPTISSTVWLSSSSSHLSPITSPSKLKLKPKPKLVATMLRRDVPVGTSPGTMTMNIAFVVVAVASAVFVAAPQVTDHSNGYGRSAADKREGFGVHYCIHCASPRTVLKHKTLLDAMDQLLYLRQTEYPNSVVNVDCDRLTNGSIQRQYQQCKYPYCYSITFDDHVGSPLTIRGCAESFVPPKPLEKKDSNYCRRVHGTLGIAECVCKQTTYCQPSSSSRSIGTFQRFRLQLVVCLAALCLMAR